MYAIIGATGHIGSRIATNLLGRGEKVRLISRDAARLQQYTERGAEAAVGDLTDVGFLTTAFSGVKAVFSMIPPNNRARDFRAYQDIIGNSIAMAIVNAGVSHVVNLSSQGAELPRGTGPIAGLHDQEERLNGLAQVNVLHLRSTYFMENLLVNIPLIHEHGFAGSAVRGDRKFAMIATRDIADRASGHLLARDFSGKSYRDLLGQRDLDLNEAFTVIGRRIGIPDLKYVQFSYDDAAKAMVAMGLSANFSALIIEMSKALNLGLFAVNRPRTVENTTLTSIEEFATQFAEAYTAAAWRKAA
jgi:uncharacterized protein YbjT (DUF2867 family)